MKIGLTGSTGFVGRHVLAELLRRDDLEIVISTRRPMSAPEERRVTRVHLDVSVGGDALYDALNRPDVLLHLAWGGLPNYRSPHHFEHELPTQYRFLSDLVRSGLTRLLVVGTCFEYGMRDGMMREEMHPRPTNSYGFAKDALRRQLGFLQDQTPFALTWARLFYMYGPGQPHGSLYSQWDSARKAGVKVFDMSRGDQLRDFLPVEEVAQKLVALALDVPPAGIVNVCSGRPTSVRALVESWVQASGQGMTLNLGRYPYPDYEPLAFWGSSAKLDLLLGRHAGAG